MGECLFYVRVVYDCISMSILHKCQKANVICYVFLETMPILENSQLGYGPLKLLPSS